MRVSVVIPAYNYGRFVAVAVESVLAQTLPAYEVIVVDDSSTDNTLEELRRFGDRIRVITQPNGGVAAARNRGVAASTGELLAFLDADDTWGPTKLALQVEAFAQNPQVGMVHCGLHYTDIDGGILSTDIDGRSGRIADDMLLFRTSPCAPGSASLIPRVVFDDVGGYSPDCPPAEDWELCYRIARKYEVTFVASPLVFYRQHGNGAHLNMDRFARGAGAALQKAFSTTDPAILALKRRSYGAFYRILAGGRLAAGDRPGAVRDLVKSLAQDPISTASHAIRAVARRLQQRIG